MIIFELKHPKVEPTLLGFIPLFFDMKDPRPAKQQIDANYQHGGGWNPLPGFRMLDDGRIQYGSTEEDGEEEPDPPLDLYAEAFLPLTKETIRVYDCAWVVVMQADGSFEATRMD